MRTAEEILVAKLRERFGESVTSDILLEFPTSLAAMEEYASQYKEELSRLKGGWISVGERVPEQGRWCLIFSWRGTMMASFWGDTWAIFDWENPGYRINCGDVSHWQPLPPPPDSKIEPEQSGEGESGKLTGEKPEFLKIGDGLLTKEKDNPNYDPCNTLNRDEEISYNTGYHRASEAVGEHIWNTYVVPAQQEVQRTKDEVMDKLAQAGQAIGVLSEEKEALVKEVERLKQSRNTMHRIAVDEKVTVESLEAENARLREALKESHAMLLCCQGVISVGGGMEGFLTEIRSLMVKDLDLISPPVSKVQAAFLKRLQDKYC